MVLELHVSGPGFGLPSIDPRCLAVIAICRESLPSNSWILASANESAANPIGELPALKDDNLWISGFKNIVCHLKESSNQAWNIDEHLNLQQLGDCTALTSFIESRGFPLLDLLLYVSSENYNACTKVTLGHLLPWPYSWVLPGQLRDRAKKRSEHLGLSSLDVDNAEDDKDKDAGLSGQIPASLRKPRQTVSSLLGRDMRKNRFRLDAVISAFLEPLDDMLGQKTWLFGDRPSSADCLAIAVLSLMYSPKDLPHPWLKNALDQRYPRLAQWAQENSASWFSDSFQSEGGIRKGEPRPKLLWKESQDRSWDRVLTTVVTDIAGLIPMLGTHLSAKEIHTSYGERLTARQREKQMALVRISKQQLWYSQLLLSMLSLSTLTSILWWKGMLAFPRRSPSIPLQRFGEAGSILGLG